jgi:DNA (cytosine-5)-methyltransferase 1
MGYTPAAGLFSAAEVGAPHQRLRIFILAHTGCAELEGQQ